MTTFVGAWDCEYCDRVKIPGYVYECPGCGHPRSQGIQFYLPEDAPVATPAQIELMGHDPNWYCLSCNAGNRDKNHTCWQCGAPRDAAPSQPTEDYREESDIPRTSRPARSERTSIVENPESAAPLGIWDRIRQNEETPPDPEPAYRVTPEGAARYTLQKNLPYVGIGVGVVALVMVIYFLFFNVHTTQATVTGFSWARTVEVQEYRLLAGEGWAQPSDATPTGHETRQSGTRKVHDGYHTRYYTGTCYRSVYHSKTCTRNNGNGSFSTYECGSASSESYSCPKSEQVEDYHYEPVYDTWYFYKVWRWVLIETWKSAGNDHNPYWSSEGHAVDELHRRNQVSQTYTVTFHSDEIGDFSRTYSLEDWNQIFLEEPFDVQTNAVHTVISLEPSK